MQAPPIFVFEEQQQHLLPSWVVTCFTINVIMGSGFLGVPNGFREAGLLLGPLVLLAVTLFQWTAACQLAQVISRANALLGAENAAATLTPTLAPLAKSEADSAAKLRPSPPSLNVPSHTSYEMLMLCRLHLGRWAERAVMISACLYMFGSLWSFVSVFASSMSATVPLPGLLGAAEQLKPCDIYKTDIYGGGCITLYYFWALAFALLMVALMGLDVREQAAFQCAMTALRALIIILMTGTLLLGERSDFGLADSEDGAPPPPPPPLVRWEGLPKMVPIGVFCQLFQIGVPSLLQPLQRKRAFPRIFGAALGATFSMYMMLGLSAAFVLGDDVDPSCNLNWAAYRRSPAVALAVALFPALDCLSVFPMNAIFLSNNVLATLFQRRWHAGAISRQTRYACRLACCVPPFACAFAFPSLSRALDFTGIVGIVLPFIITPLLHRASLRECRARWGRDRFDDFEADGDYAGRGWSPPGLVSAAGAAGALLLAYTVACGFS